MPRIKTPGLDTSRALIGPNMGPNHNFTFAACLGRSHSFAQSHVSLLDQSPLLAVKSYVGHVSCRIRVDVSALINLHFLSILHLSPVWLLAFSAPIIALTKGEGGREEKKKEKKRFLSFLEREKWREIQRL